MLAVILVLKAIAMFFPLCVTTVVTFGGPDRVAGSITNTLSFPGR